MTFKTAYASADVFDVLYESYADLAGEVLEPKTDPLLAWLARLRLLEQVPFAYLVPHDELLPPESIRFFYLNRNWTDAAVDGAISVGAVTSLDRELVAAAHGALRDAVDEAEREIRAVEAPASGTADVITGLLLRSRAVSGWPELQVHAYRSDDRMRFLRFERLAPAVLLVLIDGIPDRIEIDEPRQGIQFGIDQGQTGSTVRTKNPADGTLLGSAPVSYRKDSPGVVHVQALAQTLADETTPGGEPLVTDPTGGSDEFAIQLLQFPYRQPFGDEVDLPSYFVASLPASIVIASHGGLPDG